MKTQIGIIGICNGHELLIRYAMEHGMILPEEVAATVEKQATLAACQTLEAHDPTVQFVDYLPCTVPHQLSFGPERTIVRVVPMFMQRAAYTATVPTEEAYEMVKDLLGCGMYHLTAIPA